MDLTPEERERVLAPHHRQGPSLSVEAQAAVDEWFPYPDKRYEDAKGILDDYADERELED